MTSREPPPQTAPDAPPGVAVTRSIAGLEARFFRMAWPLRHPVLSLGALVAAAAAWVLGALPSGVPPAAILLLLCLFPLSLLGRARRATITPQQLHVAGGWRTESIRLEAIEAVEVRPQDPAWVLGNQPIDRAPGELIARVEGRERRLLAGVPVAQLRWLAEELNAAIAARKSALLAAGHDAAALAEPPPEAGRLKAIARRAGDPAAG